MSNGFDPHDPTLPKLDWVTEWGMLYWCIGAFIAEWSKYERAVARLEAHARSKQYKVVRDELLKPPMKRFIQYLKNLRDDFDHLPSVKNLLDDLICNHEQTVKDRHDIVHGYWQGHDNLGHYVKRLGSGEDERVRHFTAYEMLALNNRIQAMTFATIQICDAISAARGEALVRNKV